MPSFNDFLGGRPINETRPRKEIGAEALIGPVLRSEAVDVDNSELYLLDGTYLGTLNQLRSFNVAIRLSGLLLVNSYICGMLYA